MPTTAAKPTAPKKQPSKIGIVESDKRDKSRKVVVPNLTTHPKYGKIIRKRSVLHIHDENNESRRGDMVEIVPCVPVSKTKRWRLLRIVRAQAQKQFTAVAAPETVDAAAEGAAESA